MSVYLVLTHGRPSPDTDMSDWGSDGPVLGPLAWVHTTYLSTIAVGDDLELNVVADLIYYDGVYYGDMTICSLEGLRKDRLDQNALAFIQEKADLPAK